MDEAIMQYLKSEYNLLVGERTAEAIKIQIGSAYPLDEPLTMEVKGRNMIEGVPRTRILNDSEIRKALSRNLAGSEDSNRCYRRNANPILTGPKPRLCAMLSLMVSKRSR
jgi:hypothetical protein